MSYLPKIFDVLLYERKVHSWHAQSLNQKQVIGDVIKTTSIQLKWSKSNYNKSYDQGH